MKRLNIHTPQTFRRSRILALAIILIAASCSSAGDEKDPSKMSKDELKAYIKEQRTKMDVLKQEVFTLQAVLDTMGGINPKDKLRIVEGMPLISKTFQHFFEVQGSVTSEQNVTVSPEMGGVLINRMVEEGQSVTKGQAIAKIDDEMIQQNIEELKKRLELATDLFTRQQNLYEKKIGSEIQYLQTKNNKESLEKSLATLESQRDKSIVRSPISGVIDEFFVNKGEMVAAGMPIARIVNLNSVEVSCDVAENYLTDVKKGDMVNIQFPAINREVNTKISTIGKFINPSNRTFKVTMKLDNYDGMLRPNTMAVVKIMDFEQEKAITAPNELIQRSTSGDVFVFKLDQRGPEYFAVKTIIKTGMSYEGETLVTEGLKPGDQIISKGFNEVTDQEEVRLYKISEQNTAQAAN